MTYLVEQVCIVMSFVFYYYIASIVNFEKSTYSILEASGPAQPVLVLNNPSSSDVTVQVMSFDQEASATGMYPEYTYEG